VTGRNKLSILWVEDDPNDVALLHRAFKKAGIAPVHICQDGEDAMPISEATRRMMIEKCFRRRVL
jgi:CheY-like chemotaxis protein